jgi:hypothetical protein
MTTCTYVSENPAWIQHCSTTPEKKKTGDASAFRKAPASVPPDFGAARLGSFSIQSTLMLVPRVVVCRHPSRVTTGVLDELARLCQMDVFGTGALNTGGNPRRIRSFWKKSSTKNSLATDL